jgi:hypothetical protein
MSDENVGVAVVVTTTVIIFTHLPLLVYIPASGENSCPVLGFVGCLTSSVPACMPIN